MMMRDRAVWPDDWGWTPPAAAYTDPVEEARAAAYADYMAALQSLYDTLTATMAVTAAELAAVWDDIAAAIRESHATLTAAGAIPVTRPAVREWTLTQHDCGPPPRSPRTGPPPPPLGRGWRR